MDSTHPLKAWRDDLGLTQEAAARELGLQEPTLSRYERGRRKPTLARAVALSAKTGIPVEKFIVAPDAAE